MACAHPRLTKRHQFDPGALTFGKESKSLEHSPIAEALGILDKFLIGAISALQVSVQAIGNMLNAAAESGIVQHVDNCAVYI